jgi:hypothetical protein
MRGILSTVDLLIKVAYFVIEINNVFNFKRSRPILVYTRRSTVLSHPLSGSTYSFSSL